MSADQFCEEPPSPWTKSAGGSPEVDGGRQRTVIVSPGREAVRSFSPAPTRTDLAGGTAATMRASGGSIEDMRQCYETITRATVCSRSQTA